MLKNENGDSGLPPTGEFQDGVSDIDQGNLVERGLKLPQMTNAPASYMFFDCTVGVMLDSGIVVHNVLPQVDNLPDTLSSAELNDAFGDIGGPGVNLRCDDQYTDIVQRMGHSRYWFRLWGQALRFNYRVPIPSLKSVGGVAVVPYDRNPQWAFNRIYPGANYSGVILWHAAWSLWYTVVLPPRSNSIPEVDPSAHITGASASTVEGAQVPFSQRDSSSVKSAPSGGVITPK